MSRATHLLAVGLALAIFPSIAQADPQSGLEPAPEAFDRSTPRRTMRSFLAAERRADDATARYALSLAHLSNVEQREESLELASHLALIIDHALPLDLDTIPDEPAERAGERVEVGDVALGESTVSLTLVSTQTRDGELVWVVDDAFVRLIPELYDEHAPVWLEEVLPSSVSRVHVGDFSLWQLVALALVVVVAVLLGRVVAAILLRVGARVAARTETKWDDALLGTLRGPTRWLLATLIGWISAAPLRLSGRAGALLEQILALALIVGIAWLAHRMVVFAGRVLLERAQSASPDSTDQDLRLRGLRTQILVLRRVISIIIGIVAGALVLVQFEVVRSVGLSLLASAGMAGIVIGLAAQRSIATLLAGIQLSITQPIRIGDTVVVESEWGKIEEINLTYVVVKIWDERRLVVPMTRFLEEPFQNWTKVSQKLHGVVFLHADPTLRVDSMRAELDRILEGHPKWDGRSKAVVVTDAKERSIEVRVVVTAKDASDQWDLRCDVREKLVAWLRDHEGGRYLPRLRVEQGDAVGAATA